MNARLGLAEALHGQAKACAALGSPFTARLLRLCADRLTPGTPLTDRLFGWPGDITARADSVPLRLAGALHALVQSGQDTPLAAVYPPHEAADAALWDAVAAALVRHEDFILRWLDSPPQTNEVRRSAVLIALAAWLENRIGLPLVLSELGASAGLNLLWDRYALRAGGAELDPIVLGPADPVLELAPEWRGRPPGGALPRVAARRGVDLNPLDPQADRLRLMSYLWADQFDRLTRTDAALAEARRLRPQVDRGDAADWLEARLSKPHPGHLHLVFHTIAWQYFPAAVQARAARALARAGSCATPEAPLAHFGMEHDGSDDGAALTLTLWDGTAPAGEALNFGRADFHGRWVDWQAPG
ncbi:hypothetical protein U879_17170 [Defluviimonas sp. 20V17]|uniref:DUF2332 domain-containing protein n=1 Tax=Allgaiera indica TaxID=765699 RepID=A0AAN4URN6_9RHOB|nr:DUF2332 family protein [Allgaiera indica]KDB02458.1 hypothetical protein U879_17170 [Defluviimonas sp. 20V17]GHE02031.1 hypothetical protein GCM10008024_20010 [Allgaiera indica]SDX03725.1 hypothetical protein SAMN05444006_10955 [Allgaiera indica]